MAKVCLLTQAQPSTCPRLVKEADVLSSVGYKVQVISAHYANWASETDEQLLLSRKWSCDYVGGHPMQNRIPYEWSRVRHAVANRISSRWSDSSAFKKWSLCRVVSELERRAKDTRADLYIAHHIGALPAAVNAAKKHDARVGVDVEDFLPGMRRDSELTSSADLAAEYFEREYLPLCDYVTAASPGVARAYEEKYGVYGIHKPVPILNVFPLSQRPKQFRVSDRTAPLTLYWFSQTIGSGRGLEDIIQAMGLSHECRITLHLRGKVQEGYRKFLLSLASRSGVAEHQIFFYSPASPDEMPLLSAEYDVGLSLEQPISKNKRISITDQSANKIFTYLLAGNAIVATALENQSPALEGIEKGAFFYRPGDIHGLANALMRWYYDRDLLEKMRYNAWELGEKKYNWDLEQSKFLELVSRFLQ